MEVRMKKIVETRDEPIYIAKDGKEFNNKYKCEKYERQLISLENIAHIKKVKADFMDYGEWWFIKNEADLLAFKEYMIAHYQGTLEFGESSVGTWISWEIKYYGDYPDYCYIVNLTDIQEEYNKLMEAIK